MRMKNTESIRKCVEKINVGWTLNSNFKVL